MERTLDTLSQIASVLGDLLLIFAAIYIPVLLVRVWLRSRRRQLVIDAFLNSSGDARLDPVMIGLSHLARQRLDAEIRVVARRQGELRTRLAARPANDSPDRATPPNYWNHRSGRNSDPRSKAIDRVQNRLESGFHDLLDAAREVAPKDARPAFGLLTKAIGRPRGLVATGVLQGRGSSTSRRLGISFDLLSLDNGRSLSSTTFWEPEATSLRGDSDKSDVSIAELSERALRLLQPASRWLAIQMVVYSVFPREPKSAERGLDHLLAGTLLAQSVNAFPEQAPAFRRRAVEDLVLAAEELRDSPHHLAALADMLDGLAAHEPIDNNVYAFAHLQYARTVNAFQHVVPAEPELLQRYRVREAISWLASGRPEKVTQALNWLSGGGPDFSDQTTAADCYDAACPFALAASADGNRPNSSHLRRAATMLLLAFTRDGARNELRSQAAADKQLNLLHGWLTQIPFHPPYDVDRLVPLIGRG